MIEVKETAFVNTDLVIVQFSVSKDAWEKMHNSEEWKKIISFDVSERTSTEETLQSIDSTLKRIEEILASKHEVLIDGTSIFHQENHD